MTPEHFETLWRFVRGEMTADAFEDWACTFRFLDPMDTRDTMADLARERPGIRVSELAHLLSLDLPEATSIARGIVQAEGAEIEFDCGFPYDCQG